MGDEAFRADMADEMRHFVHLTATERETLAGLLRKLLAGVEREANTTG